MLEHKLQVLDDDRYLTVTFDELAKFKVHLKLDDVKNLLHSATKRYECQNEIENIELNLNRYVWKINEKDCSNLDIIYLRLQNEDILEEFYQKAVVLAGKITGLKEFIFHFFECKNLLHTLSEIFLINNSELVFICNSKISILRKNVTFKNY